MRSRNRFDEPRLKAARNHKRAHRLASPAAPCLRVFFALLVSVLLASTETARAADLTIGPGTVTSTVTFSGPGTLTFAPGTSVVTNNKQLSIFQVVACYRSIPAL